MMSQFRMVAAVLVAMAVTAIGAVPLRAQGPPPQSCLDARSACIAAREDAIQMRGATDMDINYCVERLAELNGRYQVCVTAYNQDPNNPAYQSTEFQQVMFDFIPYDLSYVEYNIGEAGEQVDLGDIAMYNEADFIKAAADAAFAQGNWATATGLYDRAVPWYNLAQEYYGGDYGKAGFYAARAVETIDDDVVGLDVQIPYVEAVLNVNQ